ncbi:response regulator [Geothrix fuzhouensis]|uniref:response regulator n=1 Tax=Geothrix fuzhouensis TaxID=2966451 RepID=UPI0027D22A70|nr:response regulator [Geothrix fuzhouensis]
MASVVMVDDEEDLLWSVSQHFSRERPAVDFKICSSPMEALAILHREKVDVLITDFQMPVVNGIELMIQAQKIQPDLSIIFITAFGSPQMRKEIDQRGAFGFIEKPFAPKSLIEEVDLAIQSNRGGFTGSLSLGLVDLVQLYSATRITGCLTVKLGRQTGRIWLKGGQVVHAVRENATGTQAVYDLIAWKGGNFDMQEGAEAPVYTIRESTAMLLLEGLRLRDEFLHASTMGGPTEVSEDTPQRIPPVLQPPPGAGAGPAPWAANPTPEPSGSELTRAGAQLLLPSNTSTPAALDTPEIIRLHQEALLIHGVLTERIERAANLVEAGIQVPLSTFQQEADLLLGAARPPLEDAAPAPSSDRHTAPASDPVIQFLLELEERYASNAEELAKVHAITVHLDSIELGGIRLRRTNERAAPDHKAGIYEAGGHSLFTWPSAMNLFGARIPSDDEWGTIFEAIPGLSDNSRLGNAQTILEIPFVGHRNPYGDFLNPEDESNLWSSTPDGNVKARCWYLLRNFRVVTRYSNSKMYSFSVRTKAE